MLAEAIGSVKEGIEKGRLDDVAAGYVSLPQLQGTFGSV